MTLCMASSVYAWADESMHVFEWDFIMSQDTSHDALHDSSALSSYSFFTSDSGNSHSTKTTSSSQQQQSCSCPADVLATHVLSQQSLQGTPSGSDCNPAVQQPPLCLLIIAHECREHGRG